MKTLVSLLPSKEWIKKEFTMRDTKWILYGVWIIYGGWVFIKPISYVIYDIHPTFTDFIVGYIIAFTWFFFYVVNMVIDTQFRKMLWELVGIYKEHNRELLEALHRIVDEVEKSEKSKQ